ncbi:tRNA-dihydrouridine(47) synthase [NAD(P)(+)] [Podosphaera aphanis]|nr:tRNA-dihydrouridine(47) synthase [NAD(P)(+)] [Podosphaera aphanis]
MTDLPDPSSPGVALKVSALDYNTEKNEVTISYDARDKAESGEPAAKRLKLGEVNIESCLPDQKLNGVALVKEEYRIIKQGPTHNPVELDDAAEAERHIDSRDLNASSRRCVKKKKDRGQNKGRDFGSCEDSIRLCNSRANSPEFSPKECPFGSNCKLCHDLREYLAKGRREDLTTFGGKCPVFDVNGICHAGWKCRFVSSHSKEIEREDGRKELILLEKEGLEIRGDYEFRTGVHNVVSTAEKLRLAKRKTPTEKSDKYLAWLDEDQKAMEKIYHRKNNQADTENKEDIEEHRAHFSDPPLRPSEKRQIYFGAETPILAPLTTQGNLPFRRLCVDFGAQLTYSEMAMTIPLIQGQKSEWALMKAHESEISPPKYTPKSINCGYDNTKDLKFAAQVSASKTWQAIKGAEVLSTLVPHLRLIDLNCGCPIDLVFQTGAGSALLDANSKLEKMIRGMSMVSGSIPITAKIRMGTRNDKPTAKKTIERLAFGGEELRERLGAPGCAAITLHGRSRQQRYTKLADWGYIAECAALVKSYEKKKSRLTDTVMEPDERTLANGGKMYFIGNGDCYSHVDYFNHVQNSGVDSVMIARGALIKPWIFEEIEKGQYLDKSATERLSYVEKFTKYGLETWGSDEVGVGRTRKFLLEWLSFAHRYIPIGILAHLPPCINDRPPAYRGRDDIETLLSSENYLDWIKISEMYLGPAHKDFKFQPKHKSNSYEVVAEG